MNNLEEKLRKDGQQIKQNMTPSVALRQRVNAAVFSSKQSFETPKTAKSMGFQWVGWATATVAVVALFLVVERPAPPSKELSLSLTARSLQKLPAIDRDLSRELENLEQDIESIRKEVKDQLDYWL